ncbi:hypothetical protein [Kocuria sp.]|nr:hypothetical protein [Kocuria sp.]MDO4920054.1 hypothetical protein [Kocuria sp.]
MTLVQFIDAPIFWHLLTIAVLTGALWAGFRADHHEKENTK